MPKSLKDFVEEALKEVREVSPEELPKLMETGEYLLVDVRELDEWNLGRLPDAIHIPRGFLEVKADHEHPKRDPRLQDRDQKLILYCGSGNRSALGAQTLHQMGFQDVLSLCEGWTGWTARDYPVVTE